MTALLVAALTTMACNRYSKVWTRDGELHRVDLQSADDAYLYGVDPDGNEVSIPRNDVVDAMLPGNVAMPIFGAVAGAGALLTALMMIGWQTCDDEHDSEVFGRFAVITGVGTLGALAPLIWYASQRSEASDVLETPMSVSLTPTAMLDRGGQHRPGLAVTLGF